jgi:alpha 1,2-mannosyltransferase
MWTPLVSALFFNIHGFLFYPLFTNYMGLGDKETFAFAMISHGVPYSVVSHGTSSLGIVERKCGLLGCRSELYTNTIVQKHPHGSLLFLHTNMKPKWTMAVPERFEAGVRRWRVFSPGRDSLFDDFVSLSETEFG